MDLGAESRLEGQKYVPGKNRSEDSITITIRETKASEM